MSKTDDKPKKNAEAPEPSPEPTQAPTPAPTAAPTPAPSEAPAPTPEPGPEPIPMVLYCPKCGTQHIDGPQPELGWNDEPHRTHRCRVESCAFEWRPADVPTRGVMKTETTGGTTGAPMARAKPADGLELHGLRNKVLKAREKLAKVQELGGEGVAEAAAETRSEIDELALLAGLPYTELPR